MSSPLVGVFKRLTYRLFYIIFLIVRGIFWTIAGVSKPSKENMNKKETARELSIIFKHRPQELDVAFVQDFVCQHVRFVSPDIVISDPNITLYTIESDKAIFVQCDPSVDLTKAYPFLYQAQFIHATKVFELSLEDFESVAEKLATKHINKNLIMLHSTGRCGSTLMSQIFDQLNANSNTDKDLLVSISEPDVLTRLCGGFKHPRFQSIARASLLFQFNVLNGRDISTLIIKPRAQVFQIATELQESFPKMHSLFMYRDGVSYVKSSLRSFKDSGIVVFLEMCLRFPILRKTVMAPFWALICKFSIPKGYEKEYSDEMFLASLPISGFLTLFYISIVSRYLEYIESHSLEVFAIRYQDLIAEPERFCHQLFRKCGIVGTHGVTESNLEAKITHALEVMKKDSQEGTVLASSLRAGVSKSLSDDDMRAILEIFKRHPVIDSPDFILPNTLLH